MRKTGSVLTATVLFIIVQTDSARALRNYPNENPPLFHISPISTNTRIPFDYGLPAVKDDNNVKIIDDSFHRPNTNEDDQKVQTTNDESFVEYEPNNNYYVDTLSSSIQDLPVDENVAALIDEDTIRRLLGVYIDHLRKNGVSLNDDGKFTTASTLQSKAKRALTMLSRWKALQIPNSIGGNGRHVIRSPFTSRSDPASSNAFGKLQIMGRPFRWG